MSTLPTIPAGALIGPYVVDREIGRGATAVVVLAHDDRGSQVAVKARPRGVPAADRRFLREFEAMRALRLPGVVHVIDAGIDTRHVWFSMEFVDGQTFLEAARDGHGPRLDTALDLTCQLLDVLDRIHAAGLAHRDIKPSNVLVDRRGRVAVLDFGIGRFFDRGSKRQGDTDAAGTMPYMAPEQLAGLQGDHRVDLFATGLMAWEALAGDRPAPANPLGWITRTCLERLTPLATLDRDVPRRVSRLVERLLDVDPLARPSARDAASELRRVRSDPDSQDWPEPPFVEPGAWWSHLEEALDASSAPFVWILDGPAGSGRRRAVEQLQRHALLQGVRTLRVRCDVTLVGGPIVAALEAVLGAGEDEAHVLRIIGSSTGALRQMWPHLPLPPGAPDEPVPTMSQVAEAAASAIARAAAELDLMLVVHDLEQVDVLSARTLHRLAVLADRALGMVLLHDPRWSTDLSERVIGGLRARQEAGYVSLPPVDAAMATTIASRVAGGNAEVSTACVPQRAVEVGFMHLASLRGETWTPPGANLWPLAVYEPLPSDLLTSLVGDSILDSPWVEKTPSGVRLAGVTARRAARSRLADQASAAMAIAQAWGGPDAPADALARLHLLARAPDDARHPTARAALHALAGGRFAEARRWLFLLDALPPGPAGPSAFELAAAKAEVALITEAEEPRDMLVDACEAVAHTPHEIAVAAILRAATQLRQGDVRAALVASLRIASPSRSPSADLAVRALLLATSCRLRLAQHDDAQAQLTRAEALLAAGEPSSLGDQVALLRTEVLLRAQHLDAAGAQAEALLVRARARGHLRDQARSSLLLSQVLRLVGRRQRAESLARAATNDAATTGDLALEAEARLHLATLLVERGDASGARPHLDLAIRRVRGLHLDHVMPAALRVLLLVALASGSHHEADVPLARFRDDVNADPEAAAVLVRWWRSRGDPQAALAVPAPIDGTWAHLAWRLERARVHLALGDRDATLAACEATRLDALERGFDELEIYARLLHDAAMDVSDARWGDTVRRAAAQGWTEVCFGALELDARRLAARGDIDGARSRWNALRARCEELGYLPGIEEASGWLADAP